MLGEIFAESLIVGAGVLINKLFVSPLDRIRTILQTQTEFANLDFERFSGAGELMRKLPTIEGGVGGFWKAMALEVSWSCSQHMLFHFSKVRAMYLTEFMVKGRTVEQDPRAHRRRRLVVFAIATTINSFGAHPVQMASTAITSEISKPSIAKYQDAIDVWTELYLLHGISGIYTGLPLTLIGSVSYRLLFLTGYEYFLSKIDNDYKNPTKFKKFLVSAVLSHSLGILTYPLDTLRKRLVIDALKGDARKYTGSLDCVRKIASSEGVGVLFEGLGISLVKGVMSALVLSIFESCIEPSLVELLRFLGFRLRRVRPQRLERRA